MDWISYKFYIIMNKDSFEFFFMKKKYMFKWLCVKQKSSKKDVSKKFCIYKVINSIQEYAINDFNIMKKSK